VSFGTRFAESSAMVTTQRAPAPLHRRAPHAATRRLHHAAPSIDDVAQGISVMKMGQAGDGVKDIQAALNLLGMAHPPLAESGVFDQRTRNALIEYQQSKGLVPSGHFGRDSLVAMQTDDAFDPNGDWDPRTPNPSPRDRYAGRTDQPSNAPTTDSKPPANSTRAGVLRNEDDNARAMRRSGRSPDGKSIKLDVPWFSQWDRRTPRPGATACYRAAAAMARAGGAIVPSSSINRFEVATKEDDKGRIDSTPDKEKAATDYIDSQLAANRPVVAGVSYKSQHRFMNHDGGITDHYVTITGKGTDEKGTYYIANDPGTESREKGEAQKFYVDPATGILTRSGNPSATWEAERPGYVSAIVKNTN
jgi:peptidoglycan hydrolase-like protein with peptidoglycan-binding domain